MKNFSELLATEQKLSVVVNGEQFTVELLEPLEFFADQHVLIDGLEILPKFWHLTRDGLLTINEPFYQWYHHATNQGWLLRPC